MGDNRGGFVTGREVETPRVLSQRTGPDPGWIESIGAAFRVERDEQAGVQSDRLLDAYRPLLDALADLGVTRESLRQSQRNVLFGEDPLAVSMEQSISGDTKGWIDYDRVWAAIEANRARNPKAFASLPKTRAEFEQRVLRRNEQRTRDQETASRGGIVSGLIGGVGASLTDPMQWPTLFVGGGGKHFATRILTEALAGAGVETMMLDDRAEARARMGEDYTAGEMLADVGVSALASGTLAGVGEVGRAAAPRVIDGVRAAWAKLPEAARKRWPDPAKLTEADLPDIAETLIGKGNLTEDEAAAITVLRRDAEVEASNPFVPDGAGTRAHIDRMEAAMEQVLSDAPVPRETSAAVSQPAPPRAAPGAPMGAMAAIERNETGGGAEAARQRLVSPKGAVGVMQVMPTTGPEAAKLAGLPWDAQRFRSDPAYNRALGQAYYREQLRVFGAADKAAAAYNAGPGALRNAMRKAEKAGNPGDWLRYMPAETRDYVAKFRTRTGAEASGGGVAVADDAGDGFAAEFERLNAELAELERADAAMAPGESPATAAAREWLAQEPTPKEAAGMPPMTLASAWASEVQVDAGLMQFKAGGDAFGVTERLQGVTEWNPAFAGRVILWERADGTMIVADGHQRVGLAKRIAATKGQDIALDAVVLRERDGVTAGQARTIAALKNISEGTGSAIDAAKVMREAGRETVLGMVPPRSALVRDADALARLSDDAFGAVVNEVVPAEYAAAIGRLLPDRPEAHSGMIDLLAKTRPANRSQADSVIRQGIAAGFVDGVQTDMFGTLDTMASLFIERAKVLDRALAKLRKLKGVFSLAAREADTLETRGNRIDADQSALEAQANAEAIELVERLAFSGGPIKDAIDRAARRLADGEPIGRVTDDLVSEIRGIDLQRAAVDARDGAPDDAAGPEALEVDDGPGLFDTPVMVAAAREFADPQGPGAKAQVESLEHDARMAAAPAPPPAPKPETAETIIAGQRGVSAEQVLTAAVENQPQLAQAAQRIAADVGGEWIDPGVKSAARIAEKIRLEGYADASELRDVARGAIVVDSAEAGERAAAALAAAFPTFDKGWKQLDAGYLDRKLIVRFPNGGVAEVQIVPRPIHEARRGGMAAAYQAQRVATTKAEADRHLAVQREGYAAALAGSGFEGIAARSADGKAAANASGVSRTPSADALPTNPGASTQPLSVNTQAVDAERATGRSSTSNSSSSIGPLQSDSDIGAIPSTSNEPDMFGGPTSADVRASLERAGEGRMKGDVAQKPPGSDGGLFDARGEDIKFRFDEGDEATGAELLRRLDEEEAAIDLVEGCLPPKKPDAPA